MKKIIFLLVICVITTFNSKATHLMGGNLVYEYLDNSGATSTPYRYKITLHVFRDCQNSNTLFDTEINVGIYYNNASKSKYSTVTIIDPKKDPIDPSSVGGRCYFNPNICIERAIYQTIIELPYSTIGFHLLWQRCCRNNLVNVAEFMGQSYYAFIPPTSYYNSSPYFSGIPIPYLCTGDTINLSYAAIDLDGDSLQYSLVIPWQGGSQLNPAPLPSNNLTLPLPSVYYIQGSNLAEPFGPNGVATINAATGIVQVLVPRAGFYAIAVEVKEFRKGQLLSTVRRDVEIIVLNCPPSNDPTRLMGDTLFSINAGRTLSFDIKYTSDDSLFITRTGSIFDPSSGQIQSPYPILPEVSGCGFVTTQFKWNTACHHVNINSYFFTVNARDNDSPSKLTTNTFQVRVNPFTGPDSITGPREVVAYNIGYIYSAKGFSNNSTILWQIEGGQIISNNTDTTIEVAWGSEGTGIVRVIETINGNCGIDTLEQEINIKKTVGINNKTTFNNNFIIYPNPTKQGYFNIKFPEISGNNPDQSGSNIIIRLFNTRGILIHEENLDGRLINKIDLSNKSKGIYYLKAITESETFIKKIISY